MNKWYNLLVSFFVLSCIGKHQSDAPKVIVNSATSHSLPTSQADTLIINIEKSTIKWTATEMRGTRKRTGTISFKAGLFYYQDNKIIGGKFIVDMETIEVTDIPLHEIIARRNLLNHLKSDEFFNVKHYPLSTLEFTSVNQTKNDSLKISANLRIRDVTKNIEFLAYQKDGNFRTNFTFNRLDWNIAYKGSWMNKTLVDKDVELTLEIVKE